MLRPPVDIVNSSNSSSRHTYHYFTGSAFITPVRLTRTRQSACLWPFALLYSTLYHSSSVSTVHLSLSSWTLAVPVVFYCLWQRSEDTWRHEAPSLRPLLVAYNLFNSTLLLPSVLSPIRNFQPKSLAFFIICICCCPSYRRNNSDSNKNLSSSHLPQQ